MRKFLLLLMLLPLCGCDAPVTQFETNEVYALTLTRSRSIPADTAATDAATVVADWFGTPNEPRWPDAGESPAAGALAGLVDEDRLRRAAGPVSSEKDGTHRGLFREHCVTCHGLAGSGAGPASAIQNPYPRNFRPGIFKWKSTELAAKPTRDDVLSLLHRGVPGTGMPSFINVEGEDVQALVDYVIYLSVRGEIERELMAAAVDELEYGEEVPQPSWRLTAEPGNDGYEVVQEVVADVAEQWQDAEDNIAPVPAYDPPRGPAWEASVQRGRDLFHGQIANCVGCHGPQGNGMAVMLDFDDWTKEYSTRLGLTPSDREAMQPFRDRGALRPRPIEPRKLQSGVFRGGGDAETLYRRITQGIAGTPMPAVQVVEEPNGTGLTESQVWDLVHYVQSLGVQSLGTDENPARENPAQINAAGETSR